MNLFSYTDYRKYLQDFIATRSQRGTKSLLAEAAGCHKTYFSQTMNGDVNLTPEHALGISLFLEHDPQERDYFVLLIQLERAGTPDLTNYYKGKLTQLRENKDKLHTRVKTGKLSGSDLAEYYSDVNYGIIHMLLTLQRYQSLKKLSVALDTTTERVDKYLNRLCQFGLIQKKSSKWEVSIDSVHLPGDHFMSAVNHTNWRRFVEKKSLGEGRKLNYSAGFTLNEDDLAEIHELLVSAIQRSRKIISDSPAEKMAVMTIDLVEAF